MQIRGIGRSVARLLAAAALCVGSYSATAVAEEKRAPLVVELFTSQGCNACPPADQILHDLAQRDDVIALALHVDYWDYIGWADSFARPENTYRQKAYARAAGEQMIYTPQMIIGGKHRIMGGKAMAVVSAIEASREAPPQAWVVLARGGQGLKARIEPVGPLSTELEVHLVRYRSSATVDILRGENAGRTLTYANIVTAWDVVAEWDGAAPLDLDLEMSGDEPAAILVQERDYGPIVAAAALQ